MIFTDEKSTNCFSTRGSFLLLVPFFQLGENNGGRISGKHDLALRKQQLCL